MTGAVLHEFDVALCAHVLNNIQAYMTKPAFAEYAEEQLDPPVLAYLLALGDEDHQPQPLLLTDLDLDDISSNFEGGPSEFDKSWESDERLHRKSIDCLREIRDALAGACADEWARASASFSERLERGRPLLSGGVKIISEWTCELRRLLRAMGAVELLPYPLGSFPTPSCPKPPPLKSRSEVVAAQSGQRTDDTLITAIAEIRDLLLNQRTVKELYTTVEVAEIMGKAEYTVREWCRQGRIRAKKKLCGRGKGGEWLVSQEELARLRNEGLLPFGPP